MLVVRQIIRHMCDLRLSYTRGEETKRSRYAGLRPLMATCHLWRECALFIVFNECFVTVAADTVSIEYAEEQYTALVPDGAYYLRYVRDLTFRLDAQSICSGAALTKVAASTLDRATFANATLVTIVLDLEDTSYADDPGAARAMDALLEAIDSIAPRKCTADVHIHGAGYYGKRTGSGSVGTVARKALGLLPGHRADAKAPPRLSGLANPVAMVGLHAFSCSWDDNHKLYAALIRACSKSLHKLQTVHRCFTGFGALFADDSGAPITYPCLSVLDIGCEGYVESEERGISGQLTPFPEMECLRLAHYPFEDDFIFRGIRELRRLVMSVDYGTMCMLSKRGVFSRERLGSLRWLSIDSVLEYDEGDVRIVQAYIRPIVHMLQFVTDLCLSDADIVSMLPAQLSKGRVASQVRTLRLHPGSLGLEQVLTLVQALPTLQSLECQLISWGDEFLGVNNSLEIADAMHAKFNLQHSCLRRWCITNDDFFPVKAVAVAMLVAADICPRLETFVFDSMRTEVGALFSLLVGSKLYASCSARLAPAMAEGCWRPTVRIWHTQRRVPGEGSWPSP
ncbi:hypothetical protein H4R18_004969 [Coemansia javaensis]|uniref:Uncharacterized protein n=1 Tax=Coemansia javaensis TaxID=2761396 RepID=A0A9W8LFI8_9FUNG|nr:hypothetical protein H4R18_004969 [Coemansia javaensis]